MSSISRASIGSSSNLLRTHLGSPSASYATAAAHKRRVVFSGIQPTGVPHVRLLRSLRSAQL